MLEAILLLAKFVGFAVACGLVSQALEVDPIYIVIIAVLGYALIVNVRAIDVLP